MLEQQAQLTKLLESSLDELIVGELIGPILRLVLGLHNEQLSLLKKIDKNVEDLLQGPLNTGIAWLVEASNSANKSEVITNIEKAQSSFMSAYGNYSNNPINRYISEYYVATCYNLLNKKTDACRWYKMALVSAQEVKKNLQQTGATIEAGPTALAVAASTIAGLIFAPLLVPAAVISQQFVTSKAESSYIIKLATIDQAIIILEQISSHCS